MAIRVGIDDACRTAHRAACADASGQLFWRNVRFQTNAEDLEELWRRLPDGEKDITGVMEASRNAWVPLAAWFRRHGAKVIMVPPEQSADLRANYSKHAKTDRLDAELLARLPALHPEGLHAEEGLGWASSGLLVLWRFALGDLAPHCRAFTASRGIGRLEHKES